MILYALPFESTRFWPLVSGQRPVEVLKEASVVVVGLLAVVVTLVLLELP